MVSLSSFSKLAAAAKNAVTSREAQTTAANLESINASVQKLTVTVSNYKGGLLAASSISNDAAALGQDIKNATGDAKKSEVVSDEEAATLIAYINDTLEPSIKASMDALKSKKTELAAANLQGTVLGDVNDLRRDTRAFAEALEEKAPESQRAAAQAAQAKVDANFEDCVKFFS